MQGGNRNQRFYNSPRAVAMYRQDNGPSAVEAALFDQFRADIAQAPVLDIGVGTGRTVPLLAPLAPGYIGIDYAKQMVTACQAAFADLPDCRFLCMDAAQLDGFADGQFAFVSFSFNGIDSVDHPTRLAVLGEVYRVLKPGGLFLFSAHNRMWGGRIRRPPLSFTLRPRGIMRQAAMVWFWLRNRKRAVQTADYEIVPDIGHYFHSLFYYIDAGAQVRQLRKVGFTPITLFDSTGAEVPPRHGSYGPLADHPMLFYAARKPG